jgi:hypothetical protein
VSEGRQEIREDGMNTVENDVSSERVLGLLDCEAAAAMAGGGRDGGKSFLERSDNSSDELIRRDEEAGRRAGGW